MTYHGVLGDLAHDLGRILKKAGKIEDFVIAVANAVFGVPQAFLSVWFDVFKAMVWNLKGRHIILPASSFVGEFVGNISVLKIHIPRLD